MRERKRMDLLEEEVVIHRKRWNSCIMRVQ